MNDTITAMYAGIIDTTVTQVVNYTSGAVIKNIMVCNTGKTDKTLKLDIDGADFLFKVKSLDTLVLDNVIVCNRIKANVFVEETTPAESGPRNDGNDDEPTEVQELNLLISGIQLGVA